MDPFKGLTVKEAAKRLGMSKRALLYKITDGLLGASVEKGRYIISEADIAVFEDRKAAGEYGGLERYTPILARPKRWTYEREIPRKDKPLIPVPKACSRCRLARILDRRPECAGGHELPYSLRWIGGEWQQEDWICRYREVIPSNEPLNLPLPIGAAPAATTMPVGVTQ